MTTSVDIQEAIECMIRDTIRVPCSKVLLSPAMHYACLDRIADRRRTTMISEFESLPPLRGEAFIRGVPAERCVAMRGTDYALVPKSTENTVTADDIAAGYFRPIPPFEPVVPDVPDERRPFHHFDTQKLLAALKLSSGRPTGGEVLLNSGVSREKLIILTSEYVAGEMLDPEVRKQVLEARVFEPE